MYIHYIPAARRPFSLAPQRPYLREVAEALEPPLRYLTNIIITNQSHVLIDPINYTRADIDNSFGVCASYCLENCTDKTSLHTAFCQKLRESDVTTDHQKRALFAFALVSISAKTIIALTG
jgi:hypothetical protein